jgi:TolB-like protein/tetratricopeptide (TPR) repeat protein
MGDSDSSHLIFRSSMQTSSPTSGLGRFVAELRRRHVVRVAVAYGAVGFVLLQAAEIVLPAFLPGFEADAALRVVVVGFLLLFPVVVALAWVYEITPQGIRSMEDLDAEAGRPSSGRLAPRLGLLGLTILAAGSAGLWWYRTDSAALDAMEARRIERQSPFVRATTTDASGPIRSLAVLPLQDFSPDGDADGYFAAGMHEALISQLSQLGTVRVISRTSTEGYRREGKSLPQIGADLGVDAVVEGSVLRADGRVRITVQLVHAASDTHLWASDYEREMQDIIALQSDVAQAITSEIESRLDGEPAVTVASADEPSDEVGGSDPSPAPGSHSPVAATPVVAAPASTPVAPQVQDAVMRGRFALRDEGEVRVAEAERFFEEALAHDSTFVPALTGLAGAHLIQGLDGGPEALRELLDARAIAVRAVRRDSMSAEAHEVLASTEEAIAEFALRMDGFAEDVDGAVRFVQLGGDSVLVIAADDTTRIARGEAPTASATEMGRMMQVAIANDPRGSRTVGDEMRSMLRLEVGGRFEDAVGRSRAALERFPDEPGLWDYAERLSVSAGDLPGAVELREERESRADVVGPDAADLRRRVETEGVQGYWEWKLEEYEAREASGQRVSPVDEAAAWSALGSTDRALGLLEEARNTRDPRLASLRTDPVWDPLRPDARFKALLRSIRPRHPAGPPGPDERGNR